MPDQQQAEHEQPQAKQPPKPPASVLVSPGVWLLAAQGNALAIETAECPPVTPLR